jgi:hypothetical protein
MAVTLRAGFVAVVTILGGRAGGTIAGGADGVGAAVTLGVEFVALVTTIPGGSGGSTCGIGREGGDNLGGAGGGAGVCGGVWPTHQLAVVKMTTHFTTSFCMAINDTTEVSKQKGKINLLSPFRDTGRSNRNLPDKGEFTGLAHF